MALREEFETSGQWLFRWRSYLPLISVIIFILAIVEVAVSGSAAMAFVDLWICLAVALFGLAIRGFTIGHTPKGHIGAQHQNASCRHAEHNRHLFDCQKPTLRRQLFYGAGRRAVSGLWYLVLIYSFVFWLYYERIIFAEEAFCAINSAQIISIGQRARRSLFPALASMNAPICRFLGRTCAPRI